MEILSSESGVSESAGEVEGTLEDSEVRLLSSASTGASAAIFLLASSNKIFCKSFKLVLDLFLCFFFESLLSFGLLLESSLMVLLWLEQLLNC